ncbi:regulatory protein TenI [Clostridium acetireducens DSM 10703]|jgi:thiamine-phosphate diphosphorylase|uniref:Regulatory protein TenI n=1 Tax=Clostridium acetireducens DSM 10703 TaxID=1121290 RepID=A0A1E8EY57_9CLOT|nr:thiamine phosphate synthase [Clostridium acetireducens]OFI05863.1 regulatory protein TenI [Clostridium acetireducens DSM 10703]
MTNLVYVVTNRKLIKSGNLCEKVEQCLKGGADAIILREKDLPSQELLSICLSLKKVTDKYNIPLIINNNIEVAKESKAFGVQLSFNTFKNEKIDFKGAIGVSIHSLEEAIKAEKLGANYVLAGHVFETNCKKGLKPRGLDFIKNIKSNISIPIIAIGGINNKNVSSVIESGASGVAIMSSAMECDNGEFIVSNLK